VPTISTRSPSGWNGSRYAEKGLLIEHETESGWLSLPEQIPCLQRTRTPSWLHAVSGSRSSCLTGLTPLVRELEARLAADVELKGADA
jgi:hypothetical protein